MATDASLSMAITAQMVEISNSDNHQYASSDFQFALRLLQEELQHLQQVEADSRIARSIRRAVDLDAPLIQHTLNQNRIEETQIHNDRAIAERLSRGEKLPSTVGLPERVATYTHPPLAALQGYENPFRPPVPLLPPKQKLPLVSQHAHYTAPSLPSGPLFGTPVPAAPSKPAVDLNTLFRPVRRINTPLSSLTDTPVPSKPVVGLNTPKPVAQSTNSFSPSVESTAPSKPVVGLNTPQPVINPFNPWAILNPFNPWAGSTSPSKPKGGDDSNDVLIAKKPKFDPKRQTHNKSTTMPASTTIPASKDMAQQALKPKAEQPTQKNMEKELSELQDLLQVLASSIGWAQDWIDDEPTTSARAASKKYQEEMAVTCNICGDMSQNYRVFSLSCNHRYCIECMRELLMLVVNRKTPYPPRCCEPLPIIYATEALQQSELDVLLNLRDIHASSKHIVCAHCEDDILHGSIQDSSAYCIKCQKFTCTHCRKPLHDGFCPEDVDTTKLFEVAQKEQWSSCEKCGHVVELSVGCFHMICRCGHDFCYLCRAKWKSCKCPTSSESSIMGRLREIGGKGAEQLRERWSSPKNYTHDRRQLDLYKIEAMDKHRESMDSRYSLQQMRAEKQDQRQIAEQIVLLRTEILELQGEFNIAQMKNIEKEADAKKKEEELKEGTVYGEEVVGKILSKVGATKALPSRKGKERARDVANAKDANAVLNRIMGYVNT